MVHIFREAISCVDKLASLYFYLDRIFYNVSVLSSTVKSAIVLNARSVPFVKTIVDKG